MKTPAVSIAFALVASSFALTVTSPTAKSLWNFEQKNTVTWTSASTDPSTIDIILVDESVHPALNVPVANGVQTSSGSMTLNTMSGITPGSGYQINLVETIGLGILAQSPDFNVSGSLGQETSSRSGSSTVGSTISSTPTLASSSSPAGSASSSSPSGANSTAVAASTSSPSSLGTASTSASTASAAETTIYSGFGSSASATASLTASSGSSSSSSAANAAKGTLGSVGLSALIVGVAAIFA